VVYGCIVVRGNWYSILLVLCKPFSTIRATNRTPDRSIIIFFGGYMVVFFAACPASATKRRFSRSLGFPISQCTGEKY